MTSYHYRVILNDSEVIAIAGLIELVAAQGRQPGGLA
jgi:hypothetical protein